MRNTRRLTKQHLSVRKKGFHATIRKRRCTGPALKNPLGRRLANNWQLYLLLIPVVLTVIYKYWPMYGIQIAFRDYKAKLTDNCGMDQLLQVYQDAYDRYAAAE